MEAAKGRGLQPRLGLVAVTVMGAAMLSPALGVYANWGPIASEVGVAAPLVFLAALFVSLPTAISYALVSRELPSAGSAFTWVTKTTTPRVGTWLGLVMSAFYVMTVAQQPILFGLFWNDLLEFLGFHGTGLMTWAIGAALSTAIVAALTYRGIAASTMSAVVIIAVEAGVLIALSLTIIGHKATHGELSLAPFDPTRVHGGFASFWSAMPLGVLAYVGYDVISTVAEEAKASRKIIPRATIYALLGVTVVWLLSTWALGMSATREEIADYTAMGLSAVTPIASKYWGVGKLAVILTGLSSTIGVYVATVVGAARALFAMGRDGQVAPRFSELHPRFNVPWRAMHFIHLVSTVGIVIIVTALRGRILEAYIWWAGPTVFFALITYAAVNVSNGVYFWRFARDRFNVGLNGVLPVVGACMAVYLTYKSFLLPLWGLPFRNGKSAVVLGLAIVAAAAVYAVAHRREK
jgi:amino acid transporter